MKAEKNLVGPDERWLRGESDGVVRRGRPVRGPEPVGIVGLGAVGASIGLALAAAGRESVGLDTCEANLIRAVEIGAVGRAGRRNRDLRPCRVIFVAVPPGAVVRESARLLDQTGATVVDVASVKGHIARELPSPRFIPSHPLAGTHLSGPEGAHRELFAGATWVVCPRADTPPERLAAAEELIRAMGAHPLRMDAREHDELVASTSHLPHVAASSLVHVLGAHGDGLARRLVGRGFLDTTRIARADPALWTDITLCNHREVGRSITEMVGRLESVRAGIEAGDREAVLEFFSGARRLIDQVPPAPTTRILSFAKLRPSRRQPISKELTDAV